MNKLTIKSISTYRASTTGRQESEHITEMVAKNTKLIHVGEGSIVSICNQAGLSRHALPILLPAEDTRNTMGKNIFMLDTFGIKAHEADFRYMATVLTAIWEDPTINETFMSVNRLALTLYTKWVGGAFNRNFGIDYAEQPYVNIVTGVYYLLQGITVKDREFDATRLAKLISQVADATGVSAGIVKETFVSLELVKDEDKIDFTWFLDKLAKCAPILKHRMNPTSAYTVVSGSWYPGDVISPQLAMNYKPYFIAMLYTAFSDRNAVRTGLDKLIRDTLEGRRRDQAESYVRSIDGIIKTQSVN